MSNTLTFAQPIWFVLLAAIPFLLALKIMGDSDRNSGIRKMVADGLRGRLVFGNRPGLSWLVFITEMLGFALIVAALAQPRYGYMERETFTEGRNVIIAIDTSRSMLARDLEPDRLTRSKLAAQDLIAALPGERIGLMAFAGSAYMQAPLTLDHAAVRETIDQMDIYSARSGGTNLGECIRTALKTFKENQASQSAIVVFTDGDDLEGTALDAAEEASEQGVLIVPVGVGSPTGTIIPDIGSNIADQFIKDESGKIVKSRLDIGTLESIANLTGGTFINLNSQSMNSAIVRSMLSKLEASASESQSKRVPYERYQWPLALGLLLLALGFISTLFRRRSSYLPATAAVAFFLFPAQDATANHARDALTAYEEGNYNESAELFKKALEENKKSARLFFATGAAHYKNEDYEGALESFSKSLISTDSELREQAHYNIGNSLFRRGAARLQPVESADGKPSQPPIEEIIEEWENAISHYEDTLSIEANHPSAAKNRDIVKQRIEQLKKQQEQEQEKKDQEQKDDDEKKEDKEEQEKNDEENQDQEKQEDQEKKEGDGEKEDQQKKDEGEQQDGNQDQEKQDGQEGEKKDGQKNQPGSEGEDQKEPKEDPNSQNTSDEKKDEGEQKEAREKKDGSEGDKKDGEEAKKMPVPEDQKVDPKTGYSKKDARQLLQMLSDEQLDITPLRRRVQQRGFTRDW